MSWYYKMGASVQGPIERVRLTELLRVGTLTPQVEVSEDQTNWLIAPQVPGLMAEVFGQPQTSPAAPAASPALALTAPDPPAQPSTPSAQVPGPPTTVPNPPAQVPNPPVQISTPPTQVPDPPAQAPAPAPTTIAQPAQAPATRVDIPSLPIPLLQQPSPAQPSDPPKPEAITPPTEAAPEAEPSPSPTPQQEEAVSVQEQPSGPVGHIVLDPAARAKERKKRQSTGVAKLVICGVLGLAALLVAGFFTATKVFGMDFRPAQVDTSVSKFMIESPELVASINPDAIMKSKAYRKALMSAPQFASHPYLSYIKDVESVTIAMDRVVNGKGYIAIVTLKRDYRTEFVANLCRGGTSETIGDFEMHTSIDAQGNSTAMALPEPRTLLVGSSYAIKTLLERDAHPKLFPRESELIASAHENNKGVKVMMHFDSVRSAAAKLRREAKEKMKGYDEEKHESVADIMEKIDKTAKDLDYAAKSIRHATVEIEFADDLTISATAECGSNSKAKKLVSLYQDLAANMPVGQANAAKVVPVAEGTRVIARTTIDPSEVSDAVSLAAIGQSGP